MKPKSSDTISRVASTGVASRHGYRTAVLGGSGARGVSMLEYAFLALLILLVCIAGVTVIGQKTVENLHIEEFGDALSSN